MTITAPPDPPDIDDPENFATKAQAFVEWLVTFRNELDAIIGVTIPAGSAAAGTLTGTTLASNVVTSSLTSVGTLVALSTTGILSKSKCASVYQYTAWDPSDVAGTQTNAPATAAATSAAADYITVANSSGTTTWTCVKAGIFKFTIAQQNEGAAANTRLVGTATLGGTATRLLSPTAILVMGDWGESSPGGDEAGSFVFYASMTAGQTVTILPKVAAISGGATTNFTHQCTVSAEYMGT